MHGRQNRKVTPKVVDGRVRRKNRNIPTTRRGYVIDRRTPGKGYRHVLSKNDLQAFIDLIPDWDRLSDRLEKIVLAPGSDSDGLHEFFHREQTAAICLYAWREDLWISLPRPYFDDHEHIFDRIGLSYDLGHEVVDCRFTAPQARAFTLLHVFMHELGHHHDCLTQKNPKKLRGEEYAEAFANRRFSSMFDDYVAAFGDPTIKT